MKTPPADLDVQLVRVALNYHWSIRSPELSYLPLGFGDHHWMAQDGSTRYFVTLVDGSLRGGFGNLQRTFEAVRSLRLASHASFLVPPLRTVNGSMVEPISSRFAVSVFDWLDAEPFLDKHAALQVVRELHALSREHPVDAEVEDFSILHRAALERALESLDEPWPSGPFGEPARSALREHESAVRQALAVHDHLAAKALPSRAGWCLTHGEPSGTNLLRDQTGAVYLVDWESARIAPPERDLWDLGPDAGGDPDLSMLYRLRWDLSETAVYTMQFHGPHTADANLVHSWPNFLEYLPTSARWPTLAETSTDSR